MNPIRKALLVSAVVGSTFAGGAMGAALLNASAGADTTPAATTAAATDTAAATASPTAAPADAPTCDPTKGGHMGANGTREELLTGDTADKVKAAALSAVPGATVQRVENDAEGSPYEAHVRKADGFAGHGEGRQ